MRKTIYSINTQSTVEKTLIQSAQKGNHNAFEQLVMLHQQQVIATVKGMLGDTIEVADVAQQAFINLYKSINKFRGESGIGTYVTRIAINLSLNELKRRQRNNKRFTFFKTTNNSKTQLVADNSQNLERKDTKDLIEKALQRLEPNLRSIIVLRLIDGYSTKETAEVLNIPIGTVLSRLSRARKELKHILTLMM